MNFADAAKSGFPIRRAGWKHWIIYNKETNVYEWDHGASIASDMRPEWFENEDWEVDWPDVVINTGKYWQAVSEVMRENMSLFMKRPGDFDTGAFVKALAEKLGVG